MRTRHKVILSIAFALLVAGLLGLTDYGQQMLRGTSTPNETPFRADDRYMGAGLAPFVFCLLPAGLLYVYLLIDALITTLRKRRPQTNPSEKISDV